MVAGGGAPEIYMALRLMQMASNQTGMEQYCFRAFSEALEVIPYTLAENAGLNPVSTVTELRNRYAKGEQDAGINVRKVSFFFFCFTRFFLCRCNGFFLGALLDS